MSDQDRPFCFKDGRRYHGYEEEAYCLPNDEAEAQRLGKVFMHSQTGRNVERNYQISSMKCGG